MKQNRTTEFTRQNQQPSPVHPIVPPRWSSLALALVQIGAMTVNLTLISGATGQPTLLGELGALAVVSNLAAATLLGIAALRTRAQPRAIGITFLTVGLITFPCILLTIPLEAVLPPFIIADLPFVVWGAVFLVLGVMLRREHTPRLAAQA